MKFLIGAAGLPNAGKSTFIKMLSLADVEIANYPFTTLKPKEIVAFLTTEELRKLHQITQTPQVRQGLLYFLDIPGLIRGAHQGLGMGNEFLSYLRSCDAIVEIVRTFKNDLVPHPENSLDPERDLLIIEEEIIQAERKHLENLMKKFEKIGDLKNKEIVTTILKSLQPFYRLKDKIDLFPELLIAKPWFVVWNGNIKGKKPESFVSEYLLDLKYELELEENKELLPSEFISQKDEFLNSLRKAFNLIQCFTFNKEITQLWLLKEGTKIIDLAATIHQDFVRDFKFAEVVSIDDFVKIKSWSKARELGFIKKRGANDKIFENDIILIIT